MTVSVRQTKSKTWLLPIQVNPKSSQDKVVALSSADDSVVQIKVTVAPEKGKANQAVVQLLSRVLDIPKSQLRIARGETSRQKQVEILAPWSQEECRHRLAQALSGSPEWFEVHY